MSDEQRRQVRVAHEVFDRLDEILGTERGPEGRPSANDFLIFELVEVFASAGIWKQAGGLHEERAA